MSNGMCPLKLLLEMSNENKAVLFLLGGSWKVPKCHDPGPSYDNSGPRPYLLP